MSEASALAHLQVIGKHAGNAINNRHERMMLVLKRTHEPRGERVRLISKTKSPMGEIAMTRDAGDGLVQVNAWFNPYDVLAFCIASAERLGGSLDVVILDPDGKEVVL